MARTTGARTGSSFKVHLLMLRLTLWKLGWSWVTKTTRSDLTSPRAPGTARRRSRARSTPRMRGKWSTTARWCGTGGGSTRLWFEPAPAERCRSWIANRKNRDVMVSEMEEGSGLAGELQLRQAVVAGLHPGR